MTSAPNQASISVHDVPASNCVRSRTRIPFRALLMVFSPVEEPSRPLKLSTRRARERRLGICVSSIAPGVISQPPRLMRHDGPGTQDQQRSKQCRTGCSYREATVAGERLSPSRLMATAKQLRDLFIPSKAIEFPGVLDFI